MPQDVYVRNGLAIINPYGGVWCDEVFQTPDEALKYLTRHWPNDHERVKKFKLAVATLTITLDREPGEPTFVPLPEQ